MSRLLALALLLGLAACMTSAPEAPPPWRLLPATAVAGEDHLIVTVALDEPDALSAMAAALSSDHPIELVSEWPLASISVHCFVFRVTGGAGSSAAVRSALSRDARVRTVQPMNGFDTLVATYSDDLFDLQDGLHAIGGPRIHSVATGRGVRVAVVDTLADVQHPDLASRIRLARDFVGNREEPVGEVHGTAVAGIIAADGQNSLGMVGVAPDAEILALRGCWEDRPGAPGRCTSFSLARALNFALLQEVEVINLSLGGPYDPLLAELVEAMLDQGRIVIAARGEGANPSFPASHAGVIAVSGARKPSDSSAVPAPGTDIISAAPGDAFDFYTGSSVAAAHVSGIAALLLEARPGLDAATLRSALGRANRVPPDLVTVDACAALQAVTRSEERC
ncbi:MAG: S8 family serine peptidase [Pseudomonadota bacterium]